MTIFILCQKRVLKTYQVKKEKKYPISDCKTVKPKQSCSKFIASPSPLQTKIVYCHRPSSFYIWLLGFRNEALFFFLRGQRSEWMKNGKTLNDFVRNFDGQLTLQYGIVIKWWTGPKSIMLRPVLKDWPAEKVSLSSTCLMYK